MTEVVLIEEIVFSVFEIFEDGESPHHILAEFGGLEHGLLVGEGVGVEADLYLLHAV